MDWKWIASLPWGGDMEAVGKAAGEQEDGVNAAMCFMMDSTHVGPWHKELDSEQKATVGSWFGEGGNSRAFEFTASTIDNVQRGLLTKLCTDVPPSRSREASLASNHFFPPNITRSEKIAPTHRTLTFATGLIDEDSSQVRPIHAEVFVALRGLLSTSISSFKPMSQTRRRFFAQDPYDRGGPVNFGDHSPTEGEVVDLHW